MNKQEVIQKFKQGMQMFDDGLPQPLERNQRVESLGWRHAKKAALDLEMALATVVEGYSTEK